MTDARLSGITSSGNCLFALNFDVGNKEYLEDITSFIPNAKKYIDINESYDVKLFIENVIILTHSNVLANNLNGNYIGTKSQLIYKFILKGDDGNIIPFIKIR